jgi:hypothetical protein
MKINFLDFNKESKLLLDNGLLSDIEEVMLSGKFFFGPKSKQLEDELSER